MILSVHYVAFAPLLRLHFTFCLSSRELQMEHVILSPFPQFTHRSIKAETFAQTDPCQFQDYIFGKKGTRMKEYPLPAL